MGQNRKRKRQKIQQLADSRRGQGKGRMAVKSRDMRTNFLASFLLLVASAAGQSTVEPAGGPKAEGTSFGCARDMLNVAVKISNESEEKNTAFILLFGEPSADT
jgi:hypothetical protein